MSEEDVPSFFTYEQAARLAGISYDQLLRWKRSGLYVPEYAEQRLCSFRDVVALRTLHALSSEHKIPVRGRRGLRVFGEYLTRYRDNPWSELRFHVAGKEVLFRDPESGVLLSNAPQGQRVESSLFPIEEVVAQARKDAIAASRRRREDLGQVGQRRGVAGGSPVVRGTRIRTRTLYDFHRDGCSVEDILREYPSLSRDDVEAAINFERRLASA